MTTPETGIGFRLGNPTSAFTTAGMQAAANPTLYYNTNTTPVLTNSGTWGSSPLVLDYWGSGAPTGISKARFAAMHWRGFVSSGISTQLISDPENFSTWGIQAGTPTITSGQL